MQNVFKILLSVGNIIIALNTVILNIVMVWLTKVIYVCTDGLSIAICLLLLFNSSVLSNA